PSEPDREAGCLAKHGVVDDALGALQCELHDGAVGAGDLYEVHGVVGRLAHGEESLDDDGAAFTAARHHDGIPVLVDLGVALAVELGGLLDLGAGGDGGADHVGELANELGGLALTDDGVGVHAVLFGPWSAGGLRHDAPDVSACFAHTVVIGAHSRARGEGLGEVADDAVHRIVGAGSLDDSGARLPPHQADLDLLALAFGRDRTSALA